MDMDKMILSFKAAFFVNQGGVETQHPEPEAQQERDFSQSEDTPVTTTKRSRTNSSGTRTSTSGTSKSSNGSLSSVALANLRSSFESNWKDFHGEPWRLPSGATLDELLKDHVMSLSYESTLHSCVISDAEELMQLVTDPSDQEALRQALDQPRDNSLWTLSEVEEQYLRLYNKPPAAIQEMLRYGYGGLMESAAKMMEEEGEAKRQEMEAAVSTATTTMDHLPEESYCELVHDLVYSIFKMYRRNKFVLPDSKSESWYRENVWIMFHELLHAEEMIQYVPGEHHSRASGQRKNSRRKSVQEKQQVGRKTDGVIMCISPEVEIGVMEAAKADHAGSHFTKALGDTLKLAKTMKDQFDRICDVSGGNIVHILDKSSAALVRPPLTTYGLLIAGGSISFYTLQHRYGRLYQFTCQGTAAFPVVWTANSRNTKTVLSVLSFLFSFRRQVLEMAGVVGELTDVECELPPPCGTTSRAKLPRIFITPRASPRLWSTTPTTIPSVPRSLL